MKRILNVPDFTITKGLPLPKEPDLAEKFSRRLSGRRKPKRKYATPPADAELVLQMHFSVLSFGPQSFHADMTLEIPVKDGFQYFSISASDKTWSGALRTVIAEMQHSAWFHHFKSRHVYFSVTGCGMDDLYRGFL